MGKFSRDKGKRFEREWAKYLRPLFPDARRGVQSRGGGAEVADIIGVPGFHFECKAREDASVYAALRQAEDEAGAGRYPVAVIKKSRKPVYVAMTRETFFDLLEELKGHWER